MRTVSIAFSILYLFIANPLFAQSKATWIWYPGDFEIWLGNQMQNRRTERYAFVPPFWRVYSHNPQVNFSKQFDLSVPEEITVAVEGSFNTTIDGRYVQQADRKHLILPSGKHTVNFQVFNQATPPSIYVQGKTIFSDASWTVELVRNNSADNLPGRATHGNAGSWNFNSMDSPPSLFRLPVREVLPVKTEKKIGSVLVDFGQETFGFVQLKNLEGSGKLALYYGESPEEALSSDSCETFDLFDVKGSHGNFTSHHARALRYVNIIHDGSLSFDDITLLYEYLPVTQRGSFKCSDDEINRIWEVSARTLELNTREFFLDGIKRDRWIWSGDAVQSYLMNYYSFFDNETVKRTTWSLRGADPVEVHINTILDYSLYWFVGIYDYYQYSGDEAFLKSIYPRMVTLMDFVLGRRNQHGMLDGLPGDWVFLDWAPMTKEGELSVIQLLFARSLEAMATCASLMKDEKGANTYNQLAIELKKKIMDSFWDEQQQVFVHSRKDGEVNRQVTRYANMFAMMFGYLDSSQVEAVKNNALMNEKVQKITTPYMRFYELAALAQIGQQTYVTKEMKAYWGGMLREGATSFWEQYDPNEKGVQHLAMYGRPYGRSLCHAWGASPLYLLGKYYLGVMPVGPGYSEYSIEPNLGGLQWIEGKVPTPKGDIHVFADTKQIKVNTVEGKGVLRFRSAKTPKSQNGTIAKTGKDLYEMTLDGGKEYIVQYTAVK